MALRSELPTTTQGRPRRAMGVDGSDEELLANKVD
eukprot:SAG31_NODE_23290_length_502_cov_0.872549_1_plen_34_part_10